MPEFETATSAIASPRFAVSVFLFFSLVVMAAIWCVPWFVTQDGSAHLYNAHILLEVQKPDSPLNQFYRAQWTPVPNLAGHLTLMGLLSLLLSRIADRLMITLTFVGLACAIGWLRLKVNGWSGMALAAPFIVLLSLNWMWLMGFYSFLLGACVFALTLGAWWKMRERFALREAVIIAALLFAGYFCHITSFGMALLGLATLALATPGKDWLKRGLWTAASFIPLVPLLLLYRGLMRSGGGEAHPLWRNMNSLLSPGEWLNRWQAAETLQLSGRKFLPFAATESLWHVLLSPTFLAAIALALLLAATLTGALSERAHDRNSRAWLHTHRGWLVLALLLFAGWAIGPDDFGEQHGMYLRPRLLLLALVTILPLIKFGLPTRLARIGSCLLVVALTVQLAWLWDYSLTTSRLGSEFMEARNFVGVSQRVGTVILPERRVGKSSDNVSSAAIAERFTARPILHLDNLLGVGNGNVIWNNYEAGYYMFPVKYRDSAATDLSRELDELNRIQVLTSPGAAENYFERWTRLLARAHGEFDELVVWGTAPELESAITQWFGPEPIYADGNIRVFHHR